MTDITITLLAGGVGGAKAAEGLALSQFAKHCKIIGNIADDDEFHGLWVSPDIDTLIYSLADQIDRQQGWGRKHETHQALNELKAFGQETWMTLGDLDLATHIYRTQLIKQGVRASDITRRIAERHGVKMPILLPTDDVVQTRVETPQGWLSFQQYFVKEHCEPEVLGVHYEGAGSARPTPEALQQLLQSDVIVIAPSNPVVSIGAILAIPGVMQAIRNSGAYVIAISPLIGGKTIKGPADKMLKSVGKSVDSKGIYQSYAGFLDALVIDSEDAADAAWLMEQGLDTLLTPTFMSSPEQKRALMTQVLLFALDRKQRRAA